MSFTENQLTGDSLHVRIISPELDFQSLIVFNSEDTVWQAKQRIISCLCKDLKDGLNYGLYCPSVNNRAGKFLDEERQLKDYPLPGPIGLLEFKYKRRLYKIQVKPSKLKKLHSPNNLKKFIEIVCKGDADKITEELNKGIDPNFCDRGKGGGVGGETPLTVSASLSRPRAVMLALISGGAYLDFRNRRGVTALHVAAELGNKDAIKTLLDLGASPNYKDGRGFTPLLSCVATGGGGGGNVPAQCVQMLLHDRAEIGNRDDNGWTEIHHCCLHGRVQHLEHLLFYGADVNAKTVEGDTALHVCAKYNQEECARALMFRGADRSVRNCNSEDAVTLAHLAGNTKLAEVIGRFRPEDVVLYTELPKYNEKRRGTISLATVRNLQRSRSNPNLQKLFSPDSGFTASLSIAGGHQMLTNNNNNSYTLKNGPNGLPGSNLTIDRSNRGPASRIVLLQRDETGFGFVLRGAKSRPGTNEKIDFSPTSAYPALQYFDKIESRSASERAGLLSGDFLLEVNGEDVSRASHDHTVSLIRRSGNQVTLKVMTPGDRQPKRNDNSSASTPTTNHTFGRSWNPPSLSPSTASQMRSNLAGLEELERLDATLDQYESETNTRGPSGTSLRGPNRRDFSWRSHSGGGGGGGGPYEPLAQGQHRTSLYVGQEEQQGNSSSSSNNNNNNNNNNRMSSNRNSIVAVGSTGARSPYEEVEPEYANGSGGIPTPVTAAAADEDNSESSSGSSSAFALMIKQATLNRERRVKEREKLDAMMMTTTTTTQDEKHHHQQQQQQLEKSNRRSVFETSTSSSFASPPAPLPSPPPSSGPPPPPPLLPDSSSILRRSVPPEVAKTLDENRKRDEAHAALMAAVLKRRSLLEDSAGEGRGGGGGGGDQLADDIERRLQRSRKIQVVYRGGGGGDLRTGSTNAFNGGSFLARTSANFRQTEGLVKAGDSRPSATAAGALGSGWRSGGGAGGGGGGGTAGVPLGGRSPAPFSSSSSHQSNFVSVADLSVGIHGNDDAESTISTLSTLSTLSSPSAGSSPPPPSQPPNNHHHHLLLSQQQQQQQQQQTNQLVHRHSRSHSLLDLSRLPEGVTGVTAPLLPPPLEFSGPDETGEDEGGQPKAFNAVPVSATLRSVVKNPAGNSTVFPARVNPEPPGGGTTTAPSNTESVRCFARKAVDAWTVTDVADFLDSLDYGAYKERFSEMKVDGSRLSVLEDDDLEALGVDRVLHRIKLGREVRKHLNGGHLL